MRGAGAHGRTGGKGETGAGVDAEAPGVCAAQDPVQGGAVAEGHGGAGEGVRARVVVAVRACGPPAALLQVKIFSCCFNTNMNSLQNLSILSINT